MNKDLQKKLTVLENCIAIQRDSLEQGYMHGMLNGLILAHSIFTQDNPAFESLPKKKNRVRYKGKK